MAELNETEKWAIKQMEIMIRSGMIIPDDDMRDKLQALTRRAKEASTSEVGDIPCTITWEAIADGLKLDELRKRVEALEDVVYGRGRAPHRKH